LILFKKLILSKKPGENEHLLASVLRTYQPIDYFLVKYYFLINNQFDSLILKELYNLNQDLFLTFFNSTIRKLSTKSNNMTVFFRDKEIKDFLIKHGDRKILLKVQTLDPDIKLLDL